MGECGPRAEGFQGQGNVDLDGLIQIVRRVIADENVKLRDLERKGVISERTRKSFDIKVAQGRLSLQEVQRIAIYLKIDLKRAMIAIVVLQNPMAYFEPEMEFLVDFTVDASLAMHEQLAAISGDFAPIRRKLVQAQIAKMTMQMVEHQQQGLKRGEEAYVAHIKAALGNTSFQ